MNFLIYLEDITILYTSILNGLFSLMQNIYCMFKQCFVVVKFDAFANAEGISCAQVFT